MKKLTTPTTFGTLAAICLVLAIVWLFTQPCNEAIDNDRIFAALFILTCAFNFLFLKAENKKQPRQKNTIYSHLWIVCTKKGEMQLVKYDEYNSSYGYVEFSGTIEEANRFYFKNYIQTLS